MRCFFVTVLGVFAVAQASQLLDDFAIGNNKFTADIYKELGKCNVGNFLVCPLSAEIVLALVHAGAGGQTAQQLAEGLHLPLDKEKIKETFKELTPHLQGNKHYTLSSANKIYVKDGYEIKEEFNNTAVNVFDAEIQNIDFEEKQQAAGEMNQWVEDQTHGKIKNLIDPKTLGEDTRSILINAMYFHGKWVTPFNKDDTKEKDFYVSSKLKMKIDMMEQTDHFKYFSSPDLNAKFLELPYDGEDITMTFVLPNERDGLSALEARIEEVFLVPEYYTPKVHVVIPKFTIEGKNALKPILQELGINTPFEDNADFSDILVDQPLIINQVVQKTFIEVVEEGTTASASTYVDMIVPTSLQFRPPPIQQFIADHPFIFFIKIKDVVFFAGRYCYPN